MFNPWLLLAVVLSWGVATATGWKLRGDHEAATKLEAALAYADMVRDEQNRSAKIATDAERDLAEIRLRARTREEKLRGELNNATYRTCFVPESGRMLYNAAVRDANNSATGQSGESVPAAGEPAVAGNDGRPVPGGVK